MPFPANLEPIDASKANTTPSTDDHPGHHNQLARILNAVQTLLLPAVGGHNHANPAGGQPIAPGGLAAGPLLLTPSQERTRTSPRRRMWRGFGSERLNPARRLFGLLRSTGWRFHCLHCTLT